MKYLHLLLSVAVILPATATSQDSGPTPDQLSLLETLLEERVITQAEFDKRVGRNAATDTSQDSGLTAEQLSLL